MNVIFVLSVIHKYLHFATFSDIRLCIVMFIVIWNSYFLTASMMSVISFALLFYHTLLYCPLQTSSHYEFEIHCMQYSTSALMYVCATCPFSFKVEVRLSHSLPCKHIYFHIERENATAVAFQPDGTPAHFSLKFTLLFAPGFQVEYWRSWINSLAAKVS